MLAKISMDECPVCRSGKIVKKGKRKSGAQDYLCKDCGARSVDGARKREFRRVYLDGGVIYTRYNNQWRRHAEEIGINRKTVSSRCRIGWDLKRACTVIPLKFNDAPTNTRIL